MKLADLMREVNRLSSDDLDALLVYVEAQRAHRKEAKILPDAGDRPPSLQDATELEAIFAELRAGFDERDLAEPDWAMNVEFIPPADSGI